MKVLVIDESMDQLTALALSIQGATGRQSLCAKSRAEALRIFEMNRDSIEVIIFPLRNDPEAGLVFIEKIREFASAFDLRPPKFVVLSQNAVSQGYDRRFRMLDAECLFMTFVDQLHLVLYRMMDGGTPTKRSTIMMNRDGDRQIFRLVGFNGPTLLPYGPRLWPIMNKFVVNPGMYFSTENLATVSDITLRSVPVYLMRLRDGYDAIRLDAGVDIPGCEVFRTERRDGAFVHYLYARVLIE